VKHALGITWESGTWWLYGLDKDMMPWLFLVLGSHKLFMFYNKFGCKNDKTRGQYMGNWWWKLRKYTLNNPTYVQGMMVFILHGAYHFMTWIIDELILAIYYHIVLLLAWFPLEYMDAFFTSSFQIMIVIDWYVGIGCGMRHSHFHVLAPNWHV